MGWGERQRGADAMLAAEDIDPSHLLAEHLAATDELKALRREVTAAHAVIARHSLEHDLERSRHGA